MKSAIGRPKNINKSFLGRITTSSRSFLRRKGFIIAQVGVQESPSGYSGVISTKEILKVKSPSILDMPELFVMSLEFFFLLL